MGFPGGNGVMKTGAADILFLIQEASSGMSNFPPPQYEHVLSLTCFSTLYYPDNNYHQYNTDFFLT